MPAAAAAVLTNKPAPIIAPIPNATRLQADQGFFLILFQNQLPAPINVSIDFFPNKLIQSLIVV